MSRGRILIWGTGGHGQVVADVAEGCGWEIVGFVTRGAAGALARAGRPLPVAEDEVVRGVVASGATLPFGATAIALGIGDNGVRLELAARIDDARLPTLVHPNAVISPSALLGAGTVAMPNVVVNARAVVGRAVILNSGSVVEHDCRVGEGAHLSPGALLGGEVTVGRLAWIGTGGVVIPRRSVGAEAVLGAGSTAHKDVPAGATMVGNPARVVPGKGGD